MATLAALQARLTALETQYDSAAVQSYSITGSHSVTNASITSIKTQIIDLKRRIYRLQGYTSRTLPSFENDGSDDSVAGVPID